MRRRQEARQIRASRRRRQRHQPRQRLSDTQAEAARNVIGETGRAHFRDRQAAGRQHQRRRGEASVAGFHAETFGAGNIRDLAADPDIDAALRAFGQQHGDDGARRAIAEQLSERLLVIGDAMALNERNEIGLRVAAERRLAEVGIAGEKTIRRGIEIGEVAAPAAGDQDFRADLVGMVEQQDFFSALPGRQRAHEARGTRSQNDDVERLRCCRHSPLPVSGSAAPNSSACTRCGKSTTRW